MKWAELLLLIFVAAFGVILIPLVFLIWLLKKVTE